MTQTAIVKLSTVKPSNWQANNPFSVHQDDIHIHITGGAADNLRSIQEAARKIESLGVASAKLVGDLWCEQSQWAFAQGFTKVGKLEAVEFTGSDAQVKYLTDKLSCYAWGRNLINQTPSDIVPESLCDSAASFLKTVAGDAISIEMIVGEQLAEQGWTGIYNVGKGSVNPPSMMIVDYNPSQNADQPVFATLVGKGITFDSGGYSIKPSAGMFSMKSDMGGAATVTAALALAIKSGLKKRVKLILCCAENMISSHAYKLGDVLSYKNGITVEIANTDAEGRLVLADGLIKASEFNSEMIIDAATLTGAAVMATGGEYNAIFALDQQLAQKTLVSAEQQADPAWQLPLAKFHQAKCPSAFADTANSTTQKGGGAGGASNAAGFLSRFVTNDAKGWVHIDLAACYNEQASSLWAAGATGSGIATISALLQN
ncbi:aminopeptidase PepB [Thalassotalea ponticola]|uniref:aminopeptidase PepB n=1 Tax=Thalassotalea ponticola TaxID=1523392 RepID=UPI0025B2CB2F|nr:aminopeptidase PepB [Thalassotalea ponticola]MDN3653472.1 aminopeptidase PepB [Thalassotalea ponticola]